jgi:hypothetical protein
MEGEIPPNPSGAFPLSKTFHRSTQSLLLRFFSSMDEEVVLWSDGSLSTNHQSSFFGENRHILNISQVTSLKYIGGKVKNKKLYKILNLLSAACGIFLIAGIPDFIENVLFSVSDIPSYLPTIGAMAVWSFFDNIRVQSATPERLDFKLSDGTTHTIRGDLPHTALHELGTLGMLLGWALGFSVFIDYVTDKTEMIADIIAIAIGLLVAFILLKKLLNYLSDGEFLPGLNTAAGGLRHLYFAANSLSLISSPLLLPASAENGEVDPILKKIQQRLEAHEDIISTISSAGDIFSAPSASLGVLTIGITTEKLMKRACEQVGVGWKPNARPTLISYIQSFMTVGVIDSKVKSCLNSILDLRNRAAHDFNIDSEEFMTALNQFCTIVDWYSESIFTQKQVSPSE